MQCHARDASNFNRRTFNARFDFFMADGKRVSCKNSVEHSGRFAREEAVSRFREFVDERRYVVACGEFGLLDRAVFVKNRDGHLIEAICEDGRTGRLITNEWRIT